MFFITKRVGDNTHFYSGRAPDGRDLFFGPMELRTKCAVRLELVDRQEMSRVIARNPMYCAHPAADLAKFF